MSKFDDLTNKILADIFESSQQGEKCCVKINIPGTGVTEIKVVKHGSTCIADEDVDSITKGTDITDRVIDSGDDCEEEYVAPEEDAEDPNLKKMGLDNQSIAAVGVASKLATQASGGINPFANPQKKMNKAYGDLMSKLANKVSTISNNIK